MRALFDVNVLLAVFDSGHLFHRQVRTWWAANMASGWATCPLSQNGFVRIMSQPGYSNRRPLADVAKVLRLGVSQPGHAFWLDDISIIDVGLFDHERVLGPKQLTDAYLLALAVKNDGRLVTFDRNIPLAAVRGAEAKHLVVL